MAMNLLFYCNDSFVGTHFWKVLFRKNDTDGYVLFAGDLVQMVAFCLVFFHLADQFPILCGIFFFSSCILGHWFSNFSTLKNPRENLIRQWCILGLVSWRFWLSRFGMGPRGYFSWSWNDAAAAAGLQTTGWITLFRKHDVEAILIFMEPFCTNTSTHPTMSPSTLLKFIDDGSYWLGLCNI